MKVGKVPESVLKRSVMRQLKSTRPEVLVGAGIGEDCSALQLREDEIFVISTDPITGTAKDMGRLAIQITVNDLASAGAEPVGVMLTVLLPENTEEPVLRQIMQQAEEACEASNLQILGGHTEVTRVVSQPLVSVTGVGKAKAGHLITTAARGRAWIFWLPSGSVSRGLPLLPRRRRRNFAAISQDSWWRRLLGWISISPYCRRLPSP